MKSKHFNIWKFFTVFTLLALVVGGLAGCGKSNNYVSQIKSKGVLTMGTAAESDYSPFEFSIVKHKHQVITGYDIMIGKKIADHLGVKLKVQNMEFASLFSELQNQRLIWLWLASQRRSNVKRLSTSQNHIIRVRMFC